MANESVVNVYFFGAVDNSFDPCLLDDPLYSDSTASQSVIPVLLCDLRYVRDGIIIPIIFNEAHRNTLSTYIRHLSH